MIAPIRCFLLTVGKLEIAMPTSDINVLHPRTGKPNGRFAWIEPLDGGIRLVFDLDRIFFPKERGSPSRMVVLAPGAVPEGLRRSFAARDGGRTVEYALLCDRIDREIEIPESLLRPLPGAIRAKGILGAFPRIAFLDGAAYPLLSAIDLIDKVVRFRRSLS